MKKIISIALALLMVAVVLPVMAMADDVYTTLPAAQNGVITLDKDVVLSATAEITSNVTINFNGHKIYNTATFDGYFIRVQTGYTVTMKDGAIVDSRGNEKGTITTVCNHGTLSLENMTISRGVGIAVKNDEGPSHYGKLTVTNCTITAGSNQIKGQAIQNWGEATIESGTFNADVNAWAYKGGHAGSTTINGGTFNCNVQSLQLNYESLGWPETPAQTNINGGTFNGDVATGHQVGDQPSDAVPAPEGVTSANMDVSGGTFNTDVRPYVDSEFVVTDGNNYYVGDAAQNAVRNATSGELTVLNAGRSVAFNDVKPGVTIVNNSRATIIVNGNDVPNGGSYTVPGAPIIIYTPDNEPAILSGANQVVAPGSAATFRIDEEYDRLLAVAVDGVTLDKSNYEAWSGSTYIKLLPKFMKTLSVGTHTLTAYFTSHTVSTTFTISEGAKNPATGANDFVGVAAAMAVVSLLGAAAVIRKK